MLVLQLTMLHCAIFSKIWREYQPQPTLKRVGGREGGKAIMRNNTGSHNTDGVIPKTLILRSILSRFDAPLIQVCYFPCLSLSAAASVARASASPILFRNTDSWVSSWEKRSSDWDWCSALWASSLDMSSSRAFLDAPRSSFKHSDIETWIHECRDIARYDWNIGSPVGLLIKQLSHWYSPFLKHWIIRQARFEY